MFACKCAFVCVCMLLWLGISPCVLMPLKSCYQAQQYHCSPPIHPPWHNCLWPFAHMTLLHCCMPFTFSLAWFSPEKQRPALSPTLAFLLSIVGRLVNTSPRLWLHPGGLDQNLARQIAVKRKDNLFSSYSLSLLLPLINCVTQPYKGRQPEASRM